jgi:hypothetical protein
MGAPPIEECLVVAGVEIVSHLDRTLEPARLATRLDGCGGLLAGQFRPFRVQVERRQVFVVHVNGLGPITYS